MYFNKYALIIQSISYLCSKNRNKNIGFALSAQNSPVYLITCMLPAFETNMNSKMRWKVGDVQTGRVSKSKHLKKKKIKKKSLLTTCIADDVCQKKPDLGASPPTGNGSDINFMAMLDRWKFGDSKTDHWTDTIFNEGNGLWRVNTRVVLRD